MAVFHINNLNIRQKINPIHTDQNKPRGLVEPFIVPVGVNLLQHVTHPVVFSQPDGGVHHEAGDQAEGLVADSEAV